MCVRAVCMHLAHIFPACNFSSSLTCDFPDQCYFCIQITLQMFSLELELGKYHLLKKLLTVIYSDFYNFLFVLFFHKVIVHKELSIQSDEDTISMPDFRYATITFNIIYLRAIHFPLIKSDIFSTLIIYLIPKKI